MIRNITLNNRTLLLGGGVREQIDKQCLMGVDGDAFRTSI